MFSIAVRYASSSVEPAPPADGSLWHAGDKYFYSAKMLVHRTFAVAHPGTVQAYVLMGYREIGVGAMAQAWFCIGAAVRMAQDLGLHKSAASWSAGARGIFSQRELQERSRIWYACVLLDKHISAYIGRPVAIFERDFDTTLPSIDDVRGLRLSNNSFIVRLLIPPEMFSPRSLPSGNPTRLRRQLVRISHHRRNVRGCRCRATSSHVSIIRLPFVRNFAVPASALSFTLAHLTFAASILSRVLETLYAIRPQSGRHQVLAELGRALDKWYLELPESLRFDTSSRASRDSVPPPHVLTLHMQYWTTVLLLHRPLWVFSYHFLWPAKLIRRHYSIRRAARMTSPLEGTPSPDARSVGRKSFNFCTQAANRVTSISTSTLPA
jgi:hypothetical protein